MTQLEKDIKQELGNIFTDSSYCQRVYDCLIDDIKRDVIECADSNYNSSDIRLAIQRTLMIEMGFVI